MTKKSPNWKYEAIYFIQNWRGNFTGEWFSAYCKRDNKQNSWGHWTKCKNIWDKITQEQADLEFHNHLVHIFELVDNSTCFTDNQKIALTSYIYNTWGNQLNLRKHIHRCSHKDIRYIMSIWGWNKEFPWLKHRRIAELYLYAL